MERKTTSGFPASGTSPIRRATPARKASSITSARAASFARAARPASVWRSSTTLRLPRLKLTCITLCVPSRVERPRDQSPAGGSIFTTSAPQAASRVAQ
nr:hypothetical protein [Siccirubricoccus sp. G192]